jgi:hypothetical protein
VAVDLQHAVRWLLQVLMCATEHAWRTSHFVWGVRLEHLLTVTHQTRSMHKKKTVVRLLVGLCCNVVAFLSLPLLSSLISILSDITVYVCVKLVVLVVLG